MLRLSNKPKPLHPALQSLSRDRKMPALRLARLEDCCRDSGNTHPARLGSRSSHEARRVLAVVGETSVNHYRSFERRMLPPEADVHGALREGGPLRQRGRSSIDQDLQREKGPLTC